MVVPRVLTGATGMTHLALQPSCREQVQRLKVTVVPLIVGPAGVAPGPQAGRMPQGLGGHLPVVVEGKGQPSLWGRLHSLVNAGVAQLASGPALPPPILDLSGCTALPVLCIASGHLHHKGKVRQWGHRPGGQHSRDPLPRPLQEKPASPWFRAALSN